ncbi:MAG: hypothetical protein F9K24_13370 [Leptonema illini]|jgi:hypothetical protein|uniref:Uncharacterized protein n=1 Tax=Leptonema illini TaxID=183 RepID=A0A833M0Y8_9LEPT|nr:MAG: hypothetical protein F9K24_13370 [Leptonema illini]PKL34964.1 MAG: hypothetical protein CVV45_00430 [Spirochaetae bacterium HGW-Spirochaetae-10]
MNERLVNDGHCLTMIRTDLLLLGAAEMRHIEGCSKCRTEYEIYQRLERAIATLPEAAMPEVLRKQILAEILQPGYSLRHLLAALGIACLSPVLLSLLNLKAFFAPGLLASIYGGSGLLIVLLLMPIVHFLISRHRIDIDSLKDRIDDLLEKRA